MYFNKSVLDIFLLSHLIFLLNLEEFNPKNTIGVHHLLDTHVPATQLALISIK